MSESSAVPYMTVDEYLNFEEGSKVRHEYVEGQIFAMSGSTEAHNLICVNLLTAVHAHLEGTGCRAFTNDMKVHVKAANSFYYPDIMITCEPFVAKAVSKSAPILIAEVLSPSTKQIDRREKLVAYRKIDSLMEYLLVHQTEMLIEMHRKDANGLWRVSEVRGSDELCLESLPGSIFRIPVPKIYSGLELPHLVEEEEDEYELVT